MLKSAFLTVAVLALAPSVLAQTSVVPTAPVAPLPPIRPVSFDQIPGVREFTGRLIVRPRNVEEWRALRYPTHVGESAMATAIERITPNLLWRIAPTDNYVVDVPFWLNETSYANELLATGLYKYVEPDYRVFPVAVPNDPSYPIQWHLGGTWGVLAPTGWDLFRGGPNVVVAITDTGVRLDHEDFVNSSGQSMLVPGGNTASGVGVVQTTNDATSNVWDLNGHGTHCAGIAAAGGNNAKGVSGAGWNLRIMPVRVSDSAGGGASYSALTAGALFASDPARGANRARIVSTSYSGFQAQVLQDTAVTVLARNTLWFYAAGNDNSNNDAVTGHTSIVIVGATDSAGNKASFSAFGFAIDVWAPGVDIYSTINSSPTAYTFASGTSMATPLAAGVAAVLLSSNPSITATQLMNILQETGGINTTARTYTFNSQTRPRAEIRPTLAYGYQNFPFPATAGTVTRGSLRSNTFLQTQTADNQYMIVNSGARNVGKDGPQAIVEFTSNTSIISTGVNAADLSVEVNESGADLAMEGQLWNYTTGQWVSLGTQNLTPTDATFVMPAPGIDSQYVDPSTGNMRGRLLFSYAANAPAQPFNANIDYIGFRAAP